MNPLRSQSVGALPREKKHPTSRVESASGASLDVRCACQYFQCDSLLPERINPVGSRPESNIGFVQDIVPPHIELPGEHQGLFVNRPGVQLDQLSTKSFNIAHGRHPEADRISARSFAIGSREHISTEHAPQKGVPLERQSAFDQFSNRGQIVRNISDTSDPENPASAPAPTRSEGMVVRSISDASEPEDPVAVAAAKGWVVRSISDATDPDASVPPTWQRRATSIDRISNRSFGRRDPDAISNRSFGVRRVSRSPSKTDLYVADIMVTSPTPISGSRRGSKVEIPQIHYTAPTPTREARAPFSVYEEFRKNRATLEPEDDSEENKENKRVKVEESVTKEPNFKKDFPPDPGQGSFSLQYAPLPGTGLSKIWDRGRSPGRTEQREGETGQAPPTQQPTMLKRHHAPDYDIPPRIRGAHREPSPTDEESTPVSTSRIQEQKQQRPPPTILEQPPTPQPSTYREQSPLRQFTPMQPSRPQPSKIQAPQQPIPPPQIIETMVVEEPYKIPEVQKEEDILKPPESKLTRKLSATLMSFVKRPKQAEMVVIEGGGEMGEQPRAVQIDSTVKNVTPFACVETFSLKVDELDQYTAKPKQQPPSIRSRPQSLDRSRRTTPQPTMLSSGQAPVTFKRSEILRTSQPELSIHQSYGDTDSRKMQNLVSVPIMLPDTYTSDERSISMDYEENQSFELDRAAKSEMSVEPSPQFEEMQAPIELKTFPADITPPVPKSETIPEAKQEIKPEVKETTEPISVPIFVKARTPSVEKPPVPRAASKDRMMQSNLLRRKNYFERTQSQDRVPSPSKHAGSVGDLRPGMVKTVSFEFGSHQSRVSDHQKKTSTLPSRDKRDWIDRTYFSRDHEYEPIGEPVEESKPKPVAEISKPKPISEPKPLPPKEKSPTPQTIPTFNVSEPMEIDNEAATATSAVSAQPPQSEEPVQKFTEEISAQEQPQEEDHYIPSATTTPRSESRTDHEIHTSQVDSSALEELPLKRENRKKGFMASAQDTSRRMQANLRSQAGKIRTKIRGMKKQPSGSPKAKDRKRFKGPDFSKIKMPDIKRPELPKFKTPDFKKMEFKRPEFTKFQKPDMSKFKIPDRFSSLRIKRSKSLKESDITQETTSATTFESGTTPVKKRFEFNFSTYPRALGRKKKEKLGTQVIARASDLPSTDTAPTSPESSTIPRGPREGGPVGSRWADKFSEFSSVDSESGKYQRYGSEPESYERESSLERRMKDDLEQTSQDEPEQETLQTDEQKQFAEYDEENRAIYQISKTRAKEFKQRRPMIHQDSDVVSEEGKDVGWSDKDILRNKILRGDEEEPEPEPENFPSEEGLTGSMTNTNQETQSTGSSGILRQKGVIEEIDDDEFFLRKRGISQDNIEIRQYISSAIREGFDTPMNALAQLGDSQTYYPDQFNSDISSEQMNYGYDIPPPKPRRAKHYQYDQRGDSAEISQEFEMEHKDGYEDNISLPHTGSDYFKNFPPTRPLRKPKKQYSEDSQEVPENDVPYFEDDDRIMYKRDEELNDLSGHPQITFSYHETGEFETQKTDAPPQAPKRRRKQLRESVERDEKDSYINGFGGRSISNSYLPNDNQMEEVVVYRTEHEYSIPLAKEETFTSPTPTPRSRRSTSRSRATDDDRTSHGADSMILDSQPSHEDDDKFHIEMKESDGYAVVRKEPPPRPPPPTRRKRSPHPLGESQFATMPHLRNGDEPPARPKRNYSTIGPSRPPRRKSSTGMGETQDVILPEYSPYEELDIEDIEERTESPRDLQSGDIINKMKYRPLPPPPRPPREHRRHRDTTDKFDKDEGGEKIAFDLEENGDYEIDKAVEKCIEVEVSTQTDPLPDDFVCEEFEITDDMKIIEPRRPKTLEDILKEEQEAEIQRANQLAEEENLSRSIQRFRESSQRSYSERSKGSTAGRSRSHSRPTTPSAVVIEKRMPTPIPHRANESMLEASLIVRPLDDYDYEDELEAELRRSEDKLEAQTVQSDLSSQKQEEEERLITDYTRDIRDISSTEKEESIPESDIRTEDETEPEAEYEPENFRSVYEGRLRLDLDAELRLKLESIEPESEPEAESTLRDEVTIEPEIKLEQEINLESEAIVEPEYIPKVEIKIEHKFEESTQPQVEPELEPEPKTEVLPEPKAEVLPEPKAEVLPEPKAEVLPEPKAEVLPEPKTEVQPEPKVEILPEPKAKAELKTKSIPVPEPEPEIDLELEVDIPPPQPPPRRRSYAQPAEETSAVSIEFSPESSITPIAEQPTQAVAPTRLAIADLEVERLNVHALQAGKIMVSELQGASISADDLECKSGSLNVRNLQFPPGFIEEIIERVRNIEREHLQAVQSVPAETQTVETEESKPPVPSPPPTQSPVSEPPPVPELPPARPPPPQPIIPSEYLQYSMPPPAFYQLRNPSDDEHQHSVQMHRRRRHHRRRDSSSDEDSYRERRRSRQGTRSPEPTVGQLGSQLLRACGNSVARSMNQIAHYLQTTQKEGNERNISTAIVLLILMALGILIIGLSGKTIHHHHWDFFNPPGNSNQ